MTDEVEQILRKIVSEELQKYFSKNQPITSDLLTVAEAAQYLNIGQSTLRKWIDDNKITFIQLPNKGLRIKKQWLDGWIERKTVKAINRY
jgi:excisionase family DNA binding protein